MQSSFLAHLQDQTYLLSFDLLSRAFVRVNSMRMCSSHRCRLACQLVWYDRIMHMFACQIQDAEAAALSEMTGAAICSCVHIQWIRQHILKIAFYNDQAIRKRVIDHSHRSCVASSLAQSATRAFAPKSCPCPTCWCRFWLHDRMSSCDVAMSSRAAIAVVDRCSIETQAEAQAEEGLAMSRRAVT
jgi:hypothetical protein